jgi:hypothetical protein
MSDATVTQAIATFEGSQFNIEVAASCSSAGDIAYTATTFDKEGSPAEMRVTAIPPSVIGAPAGSQSYTAPRVTPGRLAIGFQMRADDNPPLALSTANPEYNNQIALRSGPVQFYMGKPLDDEAEEMAAASRIVLRLFMPTGEETIEWSQADPGLRQLMSPCLSMRQAERADLAAAHAESEQRQAAEAAAAPSVDAM